MWHIDTGHSLDGLQVVATQGELNKPGEVNVSNLLHCSDPLIMPLHYSSSTQEE